MYAALSFGILCIIIFASWLTTRRPHAKLRNPVCFRHSPDSKLPDLETDRLLESTCTQSNSFSRQVAIPPDPCQTKSGMGNVCSNPDGEVKLPDDGDDDDDAPETYDEDISSAERTNRLTRDSLPETQETRTAGSAPEIAAPPTEVGNTPPVSNGHEPSLVVVLIDGDGLHVSGAAYGLQRPGS